jgi:flagellar biosynthesis protein FlhB
MKQNPIPKVIALVLVTAAISWLMMRSDAAALSKIDSMSPTDYIQHQRELHHHSYVFHFVSFLVLGGFYIGAVEFISYLIVPLIPKRPDTGAEHAP